MRTLLIADDERTIREGIAGAVDWETLGIYRILLAADGREAYDIILKEHPDIAIVDIIMPEMTGIQIISHFRSKGKGPEFVIISGYGEFDYAQEAIRNNVNNYILKPCDINEIAETIKKIIANLNQKQSDENERLQLKEHINLLMPQALERMFCDFLTGTLSGGDTLQLFHRMLNPGCRKFQLLLFCIGDADGYTHLPMLKKCIDAAAATPGWKFSAILQDCVVLAYDAENTIPVKETVRAICREAGRYGVTNIRAAVSGREVLEKLPGLYRETREAVKLISFCDGSRLPEDLPLVDASTSRYCSSVRKVIQYTRDHLDDSSLSINHIALNLLYLNPDYLGKLFKKEYGAKYSDYLMTVRMEKARQIILASGDLRVYEIARQVGLGDNATYFSQLFRKFTGMLPSEYKAKHSP